MISKDGIVAVVVSDSTETGRKSGNEIVVTVRKVTASENEQIFWFGEVVVAQLVDRSLPTTPEVCGSNYQLYWKDEQKKKGAGNCPLKKNKSLL